MVREFRSAHLQQQAKSRDYLNEQRRLAREKQHLFILSDFMSEWATKIPKLKTQGRTSKGDASYSMGLRLFAAEVIYGEIEGFICYLVPGHLPGGKLRLS